MNFNKILFLFLMHSFILSMDNKTNDHKRKYDKIAENEVDIDENKRIKLNNSEAIKVSLKEKEDYLDQVIGISEIKRIIAGYLADEWVLYKKFNDFEHIIIPHDRYVLMLDKDTYIKNHGNHIKRNHVKIMSLKDMVTDCEVKIPDGYSDDVIFKFSKKYLAIKGGSFSSCSTIKIVNLENPSQIKNINLENSDSYTLLGSGYFKFQSSFLDRLNHQFFDVNSLAISNNEKYIAAGCIFGHIKIWDIDSGKLLFTFLQPPAPEIGFHIPKLLHIAFNSTDKYLYVVCAGALGGCEKYTIDLNELIQNSNNKTEVIELNKSKMIQISDAIQIGNPEKILFNENIQENVVNYFVLKNQTLHFVLKDNINVDQKVFPHFKGHGDDERLAYARVNGSVLDFTYNKDCQKIFSVDVAGNIGILDILANNLISNFEIGKYLDNAHAFFSSNGQELTINYEDGHMEFWINKSQLLQGGFLLKYIESTKENNRLEFLSSLLNRIGLS